MIRPSDTGAWRPSAARSVRPWGVAVVLGVTLSACGSPRAPTTPPAPTAPAAAIEQTLSIDAHAPTRAFPHFWEQTFGSGHAIFALRDSYRQDLAR